MTYSAALARQDRLTRQFRAAADRLNAIDSQAIQRIGDNLRAYAKGIMSMDEAAGIFSVNVEELLDILERATRPEEQRLRAVIRP